MLVDSRAFFLFLLFSALQQDTLSFNHQKKSCLVVLFFLKLFLLGEQGSDESFLKRFFTVKF